MAFTLVYQSIWNDKDLAFAKKIPEQCRFAQTSLKKDGSHRPDLRIRCCNPAVETILTDLYKEYKRNPPSKDIIDPSNGNPFSFDTPARMLAACKICKFRALKRTTAKKEKP